MAVATSGRGQVREVLRAAEERLHPLARCQGQAARAGEGEVQEAQVPLCQVEEVSTDGQ
jgi:hypothetical protein